MFYFVKSGQSMSVRWRSLILLVISNWTHRTTVSPSHRAADTAAYLIWAQSLWTTGLEGKYPNSKFQGITDISPLTGSSYTPVATSSSRPPSSAKVASVKSQVDNVFVIL